MKRAWGVVVIAVAMQGCVSAGQYHDLEAKHGHLLDVKETWESEQADLSRRVEDTRVAYQRMTVDQGTIKAQLEAIQQSLRASKSDLQILGNKVEGQGNLFKEQQHQFTVVTDHFGQVITQVATLAETNHMLANRVEQLTKVTKATATKVADVNKKIASGAGKRSTASGEGGESEEVAGKDKHPVLSGGVEPVPTSGKVVNPSGVTAGSPAVSSMPVAPDPSSLSPTSARSLEGMSPVNPTVASVSASVVPPPVSAMLSPDVTEKPVSLAKPGRWQQLKELVGMGRPNAAHGSEQSRPSVVSKPVPSSGPSHGGEALAASPTVHSLSTISATPGVPAPGGVIDAPLTIPSSIQP